MNHGWRFMILYRRQGLKPSPWEKKCKKAKWLSEEALQIFHLEYLEFSVVQYTL